MKAQIVEIKSSVLNGMKRITTRQTSPHVPSALIGEDQVKTAVSV